MNLIFLKSSMCLLNSTRTKFSLILLRNGLKTLISKIGQLKTCCTYPWYIHIYIKTCCTCYWPMKSYQTPLKRVKHLETPYLCLIHMGNSHFNPYNNTHTLDVSLNFSYKLSLSLLMNIAVNRLNTAPKSRK